MVSPPHERHPDERRRRAAWLGMLAYGPSAIAVGACALALHGVAGLPIVVQPEVTLADGSRLRSRDGIRLRQFAGVTTVVVDGRRIASVEAALIQALPALARTHAVAILDSALNKRLLDLEGMARVKAGVRGRRGAARLEPWWRLVDGRSESPLETDARLRCLDAGIAPDDLQVVIRDDGGRFVGRGDLGWRLRDGRWLLVEIDGREVHDTPQALYSDRTRQNRLLLTGRVDLLRFIRADFPHHLVATIRQHLALDAANSRRPGRDARFDARMRA
ncbi:hypothetical protein [Cellulomonas rhizosphaerae]|uniref:hypothetical protein n=1 Tax=Cellulomonas rhizosphaerae TaxID=2293719 RepID=UPI001F348A6B|nr:hypothetical protein [Cellulomonas rhizosphaerae]